MSINKGLTEAGSGGKLGHSNMEHWDTTEEIKQASKIQRRNNGKKEIAKGIDESQKHLED